MLSASSYSAPSSMRVRGWYWPATITSSDSTLGKLLACVLVTAGLRVLALWRNWQLPAWRV